MQLIPAIKALSKCETPMPDLLSALLLGLVLLAVVCLIDSRWRSGEWRSNALFLPDDYLRMSADYLRRAHQVENEAAARR